MTAQYAQRLDGIEDALKQARSSDEQLGRIIAVMRSASADYKVLSRFAIRLGEILGEVLQRELDPAPDAQDGINAEAVTEVLPPLLVEQHRLIADAAESVQQIMNQAAGLGLGAVRPGLNRSRIDGFSKKFSSYSDYDDAKWLLQEPLVNFSQNIIDESVRVNAEAHAAAGLHPTISRITDSLNCPWCSALAGVYAVPLKNDVFQRHERCRCLILFVPERLKTPRPATKILYAGAEKTARDARVMRIRGAQTALLSARAFIADG